MAEKTRFLSQYNYDKNANLVLNQEGSRSKISSEPTGEADSLWGRMGTMKFGDRAEVREQSKELVERLNKFKRNRNDTEEIELKRPKKGRDVLEETENLDVSVYRPKTADTKAAYELFLNLIQQSLGVQPRDVLCSAATEALEILKEEKDTLPEKKKTVQKLLDSSISEESWAQYIHLSNRMVDFGEDEAVVELSDDEGQLDQEAGVAVIFENEDEDPDAEDNTAVVKDDMEVDLEEDEGVETEMSELKGVEEMEMDNLNEKKDDYLDSRSIDAYWLQRKLSHYYEEAETSLQLSQELLTLLSSDKDERALENTLVMLLDFDKFDLIKLLIKNREKIAFCTRLLQAKDETSKSIIKEEMKQTPTGQAVLDELENTGKKDDLSAKKKAVSSKETAQKAAAVAALAASANVVDLDSLSFAAGSHTMTNKRCRLPDRSQRIMKKGYEIVNVPALKAEPFKENEKLVAVTSLPEWTHPAFKGMKSLNRVQSRLYPCAFETHENMLLCAPTGAGKTNVAMLSILHEIGLHRLDDGTINTDAFKIVYIAPMKSLVQEMVLNFSERLKSYGIVVRELSGDQQLSKAQIAETQIIVTTPEKWDIITRKSGDRTYTQLVRLVIIDEVHLLHDDRGPVLESIVARTIRQIETTQEMIRLVGLSATLPNYEDVAAFMRVNPDKGLFFFDNSYRPCPLEQTYIGITEKKPLKRFQLMNEITYDYVMDHAGKNQVLVFVHSRKETAKTARALRDMALANDTIGRFLKEDSASREILTTEAEDVKDAALKELLQYGFAIHHAGMTREDRTLVEELFADKHIQVLVSTATLAWGVNLPAHAVIVKGTQIYSPEKGRWVELSPMDIMQMMGRAGRPQFDQYGEGYIVTTHSELQYYLSLLNQQLPIESQFIKKLADNLNAEVVLGTVSDVKEACNWLGYSYLYIRMLRSPHVYGIAEEEMELDPYLSRRRQDLIHTAATLLDRCGLVKYERKAGLLQSTDLGRVAAHYYVSHTSMQTYNTHLKPTMTEIDVFRLFSLSDEFKYVAVREEEKLELTKLMEHTPIPIKESVEEPFAKINVLLQAFISQLKLEGFALMADMVYVTQSAARLMRAIFEITLRRGWALLAHKTLDICKMIDKRQWECQTPLRQFKGIPKEILRSIEKKDFPWSRLFDLSSQELGELVRYPKIGKLLHRQIHQFPKLDLQAHIQPITRTMLRVDLTIQPDFEYDEKVHSGAEVFWVLAEDGDGEHILHHQQFILKGRYAADEHSLNFTIPISEPLPPQYFIRVISDRWLHAETILPVSFRHLILPEKYPPHTELLDLQPLPVNALCDSSFEALYNDKAFNFFNPIQTQVFSTVYSGDENMLVCSPTGSGKTVCAELALLRLLSRLKNGGEEDSTLGNGKAVYVVALESLALQRFHDWKPRFSKLLGLEVGLLTGDTPLDVKLLDKSDIIISTAEAWDRLSRRWRQRKHIQKLDLFIVDELHLIGGEKGPCLEVVVSRMRYIAAQTNHRMRIVALSGPVANAKDLGEWIGAPSRGIFNFHPNVRPLPLEIRIQSSDIPNFGSRVLAWSKHVYAAIATHSPTKPVLVFVNSRKQAQRSAMELLTYAAADNAPRRFLTVSPEDIMPHLEKLQDPTLKEILLYGIGYVHQGMALRDRAIVENLQQAGAMQVVVVEAAICWGLSLAAHLVVVQDTIRYDGREHRYIDYPITDILEMLGHACRPALDESSKAVVMCHTSKKELFKKFLYEPLPLESHLDIFFSDTLNAEIFTRTVENKQDAVDYLTWTFFYRRLTQNPNYYNMQGVTHRHLSDHLSELVESSIEDLENAQCVAVDDMDLTALNNGMIASHYYIAFSTVMLFANSISQKTKIRALLEILCASSEFDTLPMRHHEDLTLRQYAHHLPQKIEKPKFSDPHTKANVLLQCHFSRKHITADLGRDQKDVVEGAIRLLQAMVDVVSSNGWLSPAMACMELSQMVVQALWSRDSPLLQLPHITPAILERCKAKDVQGVLDLADLEDQERDEVLQLEKKKLADIAMVVNRYPSIDVQFRVLEKDSIETDETVALEVELEREMDEDEGPVPPVTAPYYPKPKDESWWLVVGDPKSNLLYAIKRFTLQRATRMKLEFTAPPTVGKHKLSLFLMCDSYLGADQEYDFKIDVKESTHMSGDEESSDEEMS